MSKLLPDLFPKGTGQDNYPETRALPELWNDLAKFEASAKDLQVQSAKLAAVAEGGDLAAIGAQLENLGKACGSCHKPFRAKKK
jgi:cytochrome c556